MRARGLNCAFLSFDDRSTQMLQEAGFTVYSRHMQGAHDQPVNEIEFLRAYGITTPERWFLHERVTYGEQNPATLMRKLVSALQLATHAIEDCQSREGSVKVIQEVGGFLSVVGTYFAARKSGVRHWFLEPAFFKGRLFFTEEGFAAPRILPDSDEQSRGAVEAYLARALQTQQIVIPEKDRHHYAPVIAKLLNPHNIRRVIEKSIDKYLLGKRQEFGYLGRQVGMHLRMLRNSRRLRRLYTPLSQLGEFVYFPLHVPGDMALTLRSPDYVDQLSLLEQIIRATPATHRVAIKEHPAMIGALDATRIRAMLQRYTQCRILHPATNNYDVLRAAAAVVSINSKSGAEGFLLSKPVIVTGDAFYSQSPFVTRADAPQSLAQMIEHALQGGSKGFSSEALTRYFTRVWDSCHPGELYVRDADNITTFTESLIAVTLHPGSQ